jgi:DNA gyrase subunit B
MNPKIRNIKLVIINSIVESDYLFSTLMGEDVFPRKDFIEKNYKHAKINI